MFTQISQILDFSHIASGIVGGLAVALVSHFLAKDKDRVLKKEADIKADKLKLIPLIEGFLKQASYYQAPVVIRNQCLGQLKEWHLRFRIHLKGRKLRAFNAAWHNLEQTTEAEMSGSSKTGVFSEEDAQELCRIQQILTSRLQALLDCVQRM
jgi:hypothetical protein